MTADPSGARPVVTAQDRARAREIVAAWLDTTPLAPLPRDLESLVNFIAAALAQAQATPEASAVERPQADARPQCPTEHRWTCHDCGTELLDMAEWEDAEIARLRVALDILLRACEAGAYTGRSSDAVKQARDALSRHRAGAARSAPGEAR